jgi:hypothetical protein
VIGPSDNTPGPEDEAYRFHGSMLAAEWVADEIRDTRNSSME